MPRQNQGEVLAAAFERADQITHNVRNLPNDVGQLQQLLDTAVGEAREAREQLEADLQAIPEPQRWALLLLLQQELTQTLKLYRFAATADSFCPSAKGVVMARKKSLAAAQPEGPVRASPTLTSPSGGDPSTKGTPPVWKKRLQTRGASVEVAVFKHEVDQGQSSFSTFSITLDRSYKDDAGKWHSTRSLRRDDLLTAAHLLQRAFAWISEQAR